jgi:Domain of unknown function (DUF4440)
MGGPAKWETAGFPQYGKITKATKTEKVSRKDAILVSDSGPVYGRQAVEKYYAEHFREVRYVKHETTDDPTSARRISADGDVIWENGEWSGTLFLQGQDCGPHQVRGYFASISIREGNTWRIRMFTFSARILPPTATANSQ